MKGVERDNARDLGGAISILLEAPIKMAAGLTNALSTRQTGGCEIPPPCWQPQPAGSCCLQIPSGCIGKIRVHVTNTDWSRSVALITASGRLAGWMQIDPTTLVIDPQESRTAEVIVRIPADTKPGQTVTGPLLVRGCRDHYIHVKITVTECVPNTVCCDAYVDDGPDHIHHWYDHFYCPRPCRKIDYGRLKHG